MNESFYTYISQRLDKNSCMERFSGTKVLLVIYNTKTGNSGADDNET